ncbi:MAG: SDR family oxidoreductase [Asticcacaulis sp.]
MQDARSPIFSGLNMFSLYGQHVLITGATSGLGLATARCCLEVGARVTITGTSQAKVDAALETLGGDKKNHLSGIVFDVTDFDRAEDFAAQVAAHSGPVSVLINNAGRTLKKPIREMSVSEFQAIMDVHVTGAFGLTRAFVDQLSPTKGSVLFVASMASFLGVPEVIGYTAAKTALTGMVRGLAGELAGEGIRVNAVAPGWIDTPLFQSATAKDPARVAKINSRIPMQRFGAPEDIGWAMVYLASPAAAYVTGQVLAVDGGAVSGF